MKRKIMALVMTAIVATGVLAGCGGNSDSTSTSGSSEGSTSESSASASAASGEAAADELSGTITAAGSSALKPLADDAAEYFNELHPDVSITIDAGGSGQGLQQVADGTVDIGNSDVTAEEKLDASMAEGLVDHQVCVITMAPIVNPDVAEAGVTDLTKDQLISIFTGETTNWSEVGGPDEDIVLITRPESSGTRATFEKYALDGNKEASNTSMETDTKGAIGYVALSYLTGEDTGVSTVAIDGVEPTLENTYNGTYPVWTYEHMYTNGEPNEVAQAFLDYIMSDDYGTRMEELGYGVSSKMTVTEH